LFLFSLPPSLKSWFRGHLIPIIILFLITAAIYGQCLTHDFLVNWDDQVYITQNPDITGITLQNLKHAFTRSYASNYAPLQIISYMIDYSIWGMNAAGFKLTNILLHALNGILFYLILVRMTGLRMPALLAATLFIVHPVQVESVAWISQRKNVLAMLFFLLSFLCYQIWRDRSQPTKWPYFLSLGFFFMSLLAKPIAVILPAILIVYDLCYRRDRGLRLSLPDKVPYLIPAAAFSLLAYITQGNNVGGRVATLGGTAFTTLLNMLPSFGKYLILLFCPVHLNVIYNAPIKTSPDAEVLLSALLLLVFLAGWADLYVRSKDLFFWVSVYVISLVPVSGIIPLITMMNDRYLYFPMLGFAAFIAFGPVLSIDRVHAWGSGALRVILAVMLVTLGVLSWQRAAVWHDSVTLWSDAVAKQPEGSWYNYDLHFAEKSLAEGYAEKGLALHFRGKEVTARDNYLMALAYDPFSQKALYNIAALYATKGLIEQSLKYALRLNEQYPKDDIGLSLLSTIYMMTGELDKAELCLVRAVQLNPYDETARMKLRIVESQKGK